MVEWLRRDMVGQDKALQMKLMKLGGLQDNGDIRRSIERLPNLSEEQKQFSISLLNRTNKEIEEGQ